jgi:hypothetical protein
LPIPYFELLLEIFEILLESVHVGAIRYRHLLPPLMDLLLKFWVIEPELLKPEGFLPQGG